MRQLGGRLPEPPQFTTDVETLPEAEPQTQPQVEAEPQQQALGQQPEEQQWPALQQLAPHEARQPAPYPVEVHRIERETVDLRPAPELPSPSAAAETVSPLPVAEVPPSAPVTAELDSARPAVPEPSSPPSAVEPASAAPAEPVSPSPSPAEPVSADPASLPQQPAQEPIRVRPAARAAETREQPAGLRITEAETRETKLAGGRWEELGELRRLEPGRGSGIRLEPMAQLQTSRGLFGADLEPEHRSSILTIVVPVIALILAFGAIVWSGSLRDRVHWQDQQMTELQEQNRKLSGQLAQVGQDQKTANGLKSDSTPKSAPTNPPTASNPAPNPPSPSTQAKAQPSQAPSTPPAPAPSTPPAPAKSASTAALPKQPTQTAEKREGVSVPPPARVSAQKGPRGAVDPNYHPMIVPPYPTGPAVQKIGGGTASQPVPSQQGYREPFAVSGSSPASASPAASSGTAHPYGTSQPAGVTSAASQSASSSPGYTATSNGMYASLLAQNIEAVETLQRESAVPLREFHASDGVPARIVPGLAISVRSPDQARGTYGLIVNSGGANYQLHGRVNSALAFTDSATHRGYELVILHIAGGQAYGYVRPVQ